jgi:hypothetical protein
MQSHYLQYYGHRYILQLGVYGMNSNKIAELKALYRDWQLARDTPAGVDWIIAAQVPLSAALRDACPALLTAAEDAPRLQREVEALRAEIAILRSEIDCSEQELDDVRRGEGYDDLENEIARLRMRLSALTPPAASEEDAS